MATTSGIRWLHNAWLNEEDPNMSRLLFVLLAPAYWTTDECTRKDSLCFNDICLLRSLATSCVHELHTAAPLPPTGSNVTLKLAKYRSVVVGRNNSLPGSPMIILIFLYWFHIQSGRVQTALQLPSLLLFLSFCISQKQKNRWQHLTPKKNIIIIIIQK